MSSVTDDNTRDTLGSVTPAKSDSFSSSGVPALANVKMASGSKEARKSSADDNSFFSVMYTIVKKVTVVGAIYFVGYMGWSIAWLITPILFAVMREQWQKTSELKRSIAKASATSNEKDVILAAIDDLPAWVYFPDVERCEWLNRIIHQVWPNANHFARDLMHDVIEPKVAAALAEYKMSGFKFDRILLGTIPPRIGGVKVYDKNVARNEIILDLDLFYASDCDITFQLAGMRGGIKDLQIHGMLRVIMKPLITKMPLVGGLQIFFLNNPSIDFNLVGIVDLLDMPGLSELLRRIIVDQIGAIMVLPNKLPIALSNEVPAIALKMPEPEGVLRIHVIEAKNLMKKDITMLGKGKSDPYAIISVGAQQFRTQTIDNTVNPKWDFWCEAVVQTELGQIVHVQLHDQDNTSDDENLGRATVEINNIVRSGTLDTWITLEHAKHGMVHLRLTWLKLSEVASDLQAALNETQALRLTNMSTAVLTVYVDSASALPQARTQSKPDPYLLLSVGKVTEQTGVLKRTDVPVWEQGFSFLVANPENDTLQLRIIDQKTEKELGQLSYILGTLLKKDKMMVEVQPYQLQKSGAESKITMSLSLKILKQSSGLIEESNVPQNGQSDVAALGSTGRTLSESLNSERTKLADLTTSSAADSDSGVNETFSTTSVQQISNSPVPISLNDSSEGGQNLIHRTLSTTSSAGAAGLGRIQLTLRYSVQRQRLVVIVHKIMNIPLKDPSSIPDPYVKIYLLPGRAKESKRKTIVIKDSCNPLYDATFEYIISAAELQSTELEVTVCTQKGFLSGGSPIIGMVKLDLTDANISNQGTTYWHDLLPESKPE